MQLGNIPMSANSPPSTAIVMPASDLIAGEAERSSSELSPTQQGTGVSIDTLVELRNHIVKIGELLETPNALPSDTGSSRKISKVQGSLSQVNPAQKQTEEPERVDDTTSLYRRGRVLRVYHKEKDSLTSIPSQIKKEEGEFAFAYLTNEDEGGSYKGALIEVYDKKLHSIIKRCRAQIQPTYYRNGREELQTLFASPFEDIVWPYKSLELLAAEESDLDGETAEDLRLLLKHVREDSSLTSHFEAKEKRPSRIAWNYIWTLFPAGTEVVARPFLNTAQIFRIQAPPYRSGANSAIIQYDQNERWNYNGLRSVRETWCIKAWSYDYSGEDWMRVCHEFSIRRYEGERLINELECYPVDCDKNPEDVMADCIQNGRLFAWLAPMKPPLRFDYKDSMVIDKIAEARALFPSEDRPLWWYRRDQDDSTLNLMTTKCEQEIIVDPEPWSNRYGSLHIGASEPIITVDSKFHEIEDSAFIAIPVHDMLRFCPPRFLGCLPKDRLIGQFKVSSVGKDKIVKEIVKHFEKDLQLPEDTKEILLAQVKFQKDDPNQNTDIIPGKGNNLVVLLHGPPGVGKTLTAETVAQATGRTLLQATIADIGLDPESAESKLAKIFSLAARWRAVLLVDEADAFLEARDFTADPQRNAFVTVMFVSIPQPRKSKYANQLRLRILEYHHGIVILTTNRLTVIDSAVQSRIHLAIKYDELDDDACLAVFETSIRYSGVDCKPTDREVMKQWLKDIALIEQDDPGKAFNGREIRNLVTGAVAIMKFQNEKFQTQKTLQLEHLKQVHKKTKDFKKQLEEKTRSYKAEHQGNLRGIKR